MKEVLQNLDKAFENNIRLAIMSALMVNDYLDFNALKDLLNPFNITDGNLASHIKHLENANYIRVEKSFVGRKPNTKYYATTQGRQAFEQHLAALEKLLKGI
ncbi:MAG: transcriptional regulator [Saprospiraceae bacterium]|nr:transcriptional regulator [Saprospiraceae bacterium]MDX1943511.1 transcriptional regulator [Saprospiraceae bacterium]